ncbi:IS5 family transposase [Streptomyces sp. NPDC058872]|uniref:IS5 family transposase n=1 Tax=Streptomyces sp. NPDC058872 TaxID=3346661 RepID=UPI00368FA37A
MGEDLAQRLVPDDLWDSAEPVLSPLRPRPQGGGTAPIDQRAVSTALVYVLTSGCAWRYLPLTFGAPPATAHRRFSAWTASGVWCRLHRVVLDGIGARGGLDWSSVIVDAASVSAKKGLLTGPNPVDRGKAGSTLRVLTDAPGLPMVVRVSAANVNDVQALRPLILGIPAVRSRRGPRRRRPDPRLMSDRAGLVVRLVGDLDVVSLGESSIDEGAFRLAFVVAVELMAASSAVPQR